MIFIKIPKVLEQKTLNKSMIFNLLIIYNLLHINKNKYQIYYLDNIFHIPDPVE